ncbi:MAG: hypothetical protein A3D92_09125 [Bacteroidetes bacterium RIFCSPHIGHO2_02_FULL_44_7]|nr:MAG: hypothetical protein A3D92_09125 [Bacteroidetes bacterium RIFCSPHIGHO2_02_FULL_44_7]
MQWIDKKYQHFYQILSARGVRIFGWLLVVLAALFMWKGSFWAGAIFGGVEILAQAYLPSLRFQYALISLLTYPIGRVVGFVALVIVYVLVITPIGLLRSRKFPHGWVDSSSDILPEKMFE